MKLRVTCEQYHARLTTGACELHQDCAQRAARLLAEGVSLYLINHANIQHLLACGQCDKCRFNLDVEPLLMALRQESKQLIERLDESEEDVQALQLGAADKKKLRQERYRQRKRVTLAQKEMERRKHLKVVGGG